MDSFKNCHGYFVYYTVDTNVYWREFMCASLLLKVISACILGWGQASVFIVYTNLAMYTGRGGGRLTLTPH